MDLQIQSHCLDTANKQLQPNHDDRHNATNTTYSCRGSFDVP